MPHSGNATDRAVRHTIKRYEESARWRVEWPKRFVVFGARLMPVAVHLKALSELHAKMTHENNRLRGLVAQRDTELRSRARTAKSTQDYIENMKGRLDQAAADGLTVEEFIDQDRKRVREFRTLHLDPTRSSKSETTDTHYTYPHKYSPASARDGHFECGVCGGTHKSDGSIEGGSA